MKGRESGESTVGRNFDGLMWPKLPGPRQVLRAPRWPSWAGWHLWPPGAEQRALSPESLLEAPGARWKHRRANAPGATFTNSGWAKERSYLASLGCPLWDSTLIPQVVTCSSIHLLLFSFSLVSLSYYQNKTKTKLNKEKPRNYVYTNLCFRVCFGENQSWYGTEGTSSGMGQVDRLWSIQEAAWTRFTQQRARTGLRKRGCRSRLRNKSHP